MINLIKKNDISEELWDNILDDFVEFDGKEHRRSSNFYTNVIYMIDEEVAPNNPELHGMWRSNTIIWDDDYGLESSDINELERVEKQTRTVVIEEWVAVK